MRDFPGVRRHLRSSPHRPDAIEREISEELDSHIAMRVDALVAGGLTKEAALAAAYQRFGDYQTARSSLVESAQRREGRVRIRDWLDSFGADIRFAFRQLARNRKFAGFNIATTALGIGLTTAVFATVDAVLLKPLPFPDQQSLVFLQGIDSAGNRVVVVSAANWLDWKQQNRTLAAVAIHKPERAAIIVEGEAIGANTEEVSTGFFEVFRPRLVWGRTFDPAPGNADAARVVVSERFWRRSLAAREGTRAGLSVNGKAVDVIGVVASGQEYPEATDIWTPHSPRPTGGATRNNINWSGVGRLADGVTIERAAEDLSAIARRIREAEPVAVYSYGVDVSSLRQQLVGDSTVYLLFLLLAVGAVLLIAVANLASANLARGVSRIPEMAVRAALGAGRRRVARQLLVEHLCVALLGGAAGTAFAMAAVGVIRSVADDLPRAASIAIDGRVLLFGFGVSLLTGVLTGLLPALQASRASPQQVIGRAGRSQVRGGRGLPGQALVGAEIALALMLFACAGLLVQSLRAVLARPLGFDTEGIVTANLQLLTPAYRAVAARDRYWREMLSALRAAPGVESAALVNWAPLSSGGSTFIETDGTRVPGAGAGYRVISEGYFAALGIPLLAGRDIEVRDDTTGPRVVVINEAMAERYWPGERPIGRRVRAQSMEGYATAAPWLTVVGVVGSVRHYGYESDQLPEMYVAYRQRPDFTFGLTAVIRARGPGTALPDETRALVRRHDPSIAPQVALLADEAARRTGSRRLTMNVLAVFAALALLLAAIGVYSVLSFSVAQRSREMALRAALGADRRSLLTLVLSSAGRVVVLGILAGLAGLAALRGVIRATLYGVESGDPLVLAIAALLIGAVAMLAALVPALRGTRVPLREALSAE